MKFFKQFLLFQNIANKNFELVRMNSLPFVNAKVPEKLKLAVAKEAKERKISQKQIITEALKEYLKWLRKKKKFWNGIGPEKLIPGYAENIKLPE